MGIQLKKAGLQDFIILEKAASLGGTWRENTYPGAECDIPSALYSYSFEHNAGWQTKWSGQRQILKYQHDTARKYGLNHHLRFNQELISARFEQETCRWQLETADGGTYNTQHLVFAVGQLHHPMTPNFEGAGLFAGTKFHSAEWQHDVDLVDQRVAVIGNAASAVQFVPKIAQQVKRLTIFQRSPNWMLSKQDRPYTSMEQWLLARFPAITSLYRLALWLKGELGILPAINGNRFWRWWLRTWNQRLIKKAIKDPQLRAKLTPDYPVGAKRILFADEYYPALARENVHLDASGVKRFTAEGIERNDGVCENFDVVIYATGFQSNPFLAGMNITGLNGRLLSEHWQDGAHAYLGVSTHGFPNMHILYGPNTNLAHNSIIIMIEAQVAYIVQAIEMANDTAVMIRDAVEQAYNQELQSRLAGTAFNQVADSWYLDGGKITNNWAGGTREYMRRLRHVDASLYQLIEPGRQRDKQR